MCKQQPTSICEEACAELNTAAAPQTLNTCIVTSNYIIMSYSPQYTRYVVSIPTNT
jgi:hypothetical protein